ncbi:hypothetical protein KPL78_04245 [Roseomonas sp. HJA6]|uniref:Uncharacterized protein n=1 Tax=Roseomonas alba TaxID=2846776 RepID=A0ABS7A4C3_9PROT|nr:hypothetical protein [Neoroseomonas alba]MBW6397043.1 hypothetical protein [Neoroseomonas alba]
MPWPKMHASHRALFHEVATHTRTMVEREGAEAICRAEVVERFVGRGASAGRSTAGCPS